jgi:hypothetical protein
VENAALLVYAQGIVPKVPFLVSITGCQLARDKSSAVYGMLGQSVDSFASKLHLLLGEKYHIYVNVFARVHTVGIAYEGEFEAVRKGVLLTENVPASFQQAAPQSKVLYAWENGKQARKWVNYDEGRYEDIM